MGGPQGAANMGSLVGYVPDIIQILGTSGAGTAARASGIAVKSMEIAEAANTAQKATKAAATISVASRTGETIATAKKVGRFTKAAAAKQEATEAHRRFSVFKPEPHLPAPEKMLFDADRVLGVESKSAFTARVADKKYFDANPNITQLDRKGRVVIDGVEIRGIRDLSHVPDEHLLKMYREGRNPIDIDGEPLVYHHFNQQYHRAEDAFLVQMRSNTHSIGNKTQHPHGNKKDAGLSKTQKKEWRDKDRKTINKIQGKNELIKRGLLDE